MKNVFTYNRDFQFESGQQLSGIEITYHTYGELNSAKDNVIWVFHALTANSDAADWWSGLIGEKKIFNPDEHFIVCANILGSCYGTSGPLSISPESHTPYYNLFPKITIRDMVNAHRILKSHLGINKIKMGIGGSMGGYQALEWAVQEPELFENLTLLATSARESAWGIAIHTTQRMAIETDSTFGTANESAGKKGLETARGIGMLTYRNYSIFNQTQSDPEGHEDEHKASTYIRYQGTKLASRFNAYSYYRLTEAMDSHDLSYNHESLEKALNRIRSKCLIIGINSDILCPVSEQKFLAKYIPYSKLEIMDSSYGHDGFLIEFKMVSELLFSHFGTEISLKK